MNKNKHLSLSERAMIEQHLNNRISFRGIGRPFNDCLSRNTCINYQKEVCKSLSKPPYVCNGCDIRRNCTLEKRLYIATDGQKECELVRTEARQGIQLTEADSIRLDSIISPLLKKGQSLYNICINHKEELMYDERTLYNYVDYGVFPSKNIDLPRKVRMSRRRPKKIYKVDKQGNRRTNVFHCDPSAPFQKERYWIYILRTTLLSR